MSNYSKGILLVGLGNIILSPDSLLIRLINIDLLNLMFLRGLFMGLSLLFLNVVIFRSKVIHQFKLMDRYSWGITLVFSISSFFFVSSIQHTSAAHTLIIIGASPVVVAILGFILLKERVSRSTLFTIFIVFIGLIFVVYDDQASTLKGDFFAFMATLLLSINFILARKTIIKNMLLPLSISGFLIALFTFPSFNLNDFTSQQLLLGSLLGCIVGVAFTLITMAPQFIPAADTAVFMPLETVLGVLLVWLFVGEYPGFISITAGSIIIFTIMVNSYYQIQSN